MNEKSCGIAMVAAASFFEVRKKDYLKIIF